MQSKIRIVDDEQPLLDAMRPSLERSGFVVEIAHHSQEGLTEGERCTIYRNSNGRGLSLSRGNQRNSRVNRRRRLVFLGCLLLVCLGGLTSLEVGPAVSTLQAPSKALPGQKIELFWEGPVDQRDRLQIIDLATVKTVTSRGIFRKLPPLKLDVPDAVGMTRFAISRLARVFCTACH